MKAKEIVFSSLSDDQKEKFYDILSRNDYNFRYENNYFVAEFFLGEEPLIPKTPVITKMQATEQVAELPEQEEANNEQIISPVAPERSLVKPTKPVRRTPRTEPQSQPYEYSASLLTESLRDQAEKENVVQPDEGQSHKREYELQDLIISNMRTPYEYNKQTKVISTEIKMSFSTIEKIFPLSDNCSDFLSKEQVLSVSVDFLQFVTEAVSLLKKQPEFVLAKYGITAHALQKAVEDPEALFCIFATNEELEIDSLLTNNGIWSYLHEIERADPISESVYTILVTKAHYLKYFAPLMCECHREQNKGVLAKATFLKHCKIYLRDYNQFEQYIVSLPPLGDFLSVKDLSQLLIDYFMQQKEELANEVYAVKPDVKQTRMVVESPEFYVHAFNNDLELDKSEFMPLPAALLLLLPPITEEYAKSLLEPLGEAPELFVSKLKQAIIQAISASLDKNQETITNMGKRSTTVGEAYNLCVFLIKMNEQTAINVAEGIINSAGRTLQVKE